MPTASAVDPTVMHAHLRTSNVDVDVGYRGASAAIASYAHVHPERQRVAAIEGTGPALQRQRTLHMNHKAMAAYRQVTLLSAQGP